MPERTTAGMVPWPDDFAARYTERGYWEGRPVHAYLRDAVAADPAAVCLVDRELRLSFQDFWSRAEGVAARLYDLGLRPDDRVILQLPNCWQFLVAAVGCLRLGVVPVLSLLGHRKQEVTAVAAHAEASAIITVGVVKDFDHEALAHEVAATSPTLRHVIVLDGRNPASHDLDAFCVPPVRPMPPVAEPDGTAAALFLLSGGTTGAPKLIARTHNDYSYLVRQAARVCRLGADAAYLAVLPLGHGFPLTAALGAMFSGGRVVIAASPQPEYAFDVVAAERVTFTSLVPAVAQRWLEYRGTRHDHDLSSLQLVQVSGSRLPDEIASRITPVLGCTLQNGYGMGEGLMCLTRPDDPADVVCRTQGRPICPDDELRIVRENGEPAAEGEAGILLTRGPYTPRGYYRAPETNATAFLGDGWYNTGDIVRIRADGNLIVEGRQKDVINRGGEKISAEEIENFAYRLDARLAAAVAMPDRELGERICLYVVGGRFDLDRLRDTMRAAGVATFKLPERLEHVDALPFTAVGKVDKKALRADIAARLAEEATPAALRAS
ncbi:(2,3-dihydroxybenzoyl)adenylate synthase [Micromonospora mangrovi]|uniref:AMP-binding protein n=2 Tax=Micromonospora TaxID=1873 RepID=A0AAU7M7E4_9ACTN